MASIRVKRRPADDGPVPPELRGPVRVADWAPELWAAHHGTEPAQTHVDWFAALALARRRHRDAFKRWARDQDLSDQERRRHWKGRMPVWQ